MGSEAVKNSTRDAELMPGEVDVLSAYLPIDRAHALARGTELPSHAQGALLFADVSGFTPLTEALSRQFGPRRGAEELTRHLNRVCDALISEVHRQGGSVIGFSGDAMTCWFAEKSSSLAAIVCALAMQKAMQTFAQVPLLSGNPIRLSMKVVVATGPARRFVVGDPQIQRLDLMAGATQARLAAGEHLAQPRDVLGDEATVAALENRVDVVEWRTDPATGQLFALIGGLPTTQFAHAEAARPVALTDEQVRPWLLPIIYERLRSGQGEFITELRLGVALFVRFEGIDYDGDDAAGEKLDLFIRWVQAVLAKYDGLVLQVSTGDKGGYLHAVFGAPIAHEDDARRAVSAALELQALPPELQFMRPLPMGITFGGMRAGAYGGLTRRTYDVMGDDVNLAARLMQAATPGEVLVSDALRQAASDGFAWESLLPLLVKGKSAPVAVYRLLGQLARHAPRPASRAGLGNLVGRKEEREQMADRLAALLRGESRLCVVEGEAGIGKSRLVADLLAGAEQVAMRHISGAGDAIEKSTPYHAWRAVFTDLLAWDSLPVDPDARRGHLLTRLPPALQERAPLLNVVLPLEWPDNELTGQMTGEVRADNTRELLLALLQPFTPLLLVLDDAHWLDSASWALALAVSQRVNPLLFVVVTRPFPQPWPDDYARLRAQPELLWLPLSTLPPDDIVALICQRLGIAALPDPVAALIRDKAEGHPFYSEELAYALRDSGVLTIENGECRIAPGVDFQTVTVPDTVEGVITSRIDRLAPSQQLTLKVASVIGRVFTFRLLRDVHPVAADKSQLVAYLAALQELDLTSLDMPDPNLAYIFKHIITQEVTYNLMTFAQRRDLHYAVGEWYEQTFAGDPTSYYPILAYHWSKTDDRSRAIDYLEKAGEQALAQYANQEAVSFLAEATRLAEGLQPPVSALRRARWARQMGEAYLKLGRHAETRQQCQRVLALLDRPLAVGSVRQASGLLGQIAREVGRRLTPFRRAGPRDSSEASASRLELARAYFCLGELAYYELDVVVGLTLMLGIVDLLEGDAASPELVNAYAGLSVVASHIGRAALAGMYGRLAEKTARHLGRLDSEAFVLQVKALSQNLLHRWTGIQTSATESATLFGRLGDRRRWEECMEYLGYVAMLKGEFAQALDLFLQKAASARQRNDANSTLQALVYISTLRLLLGENGEALDAIQTGFGLQQQSSDPKFEMFLCARLAQTLLQRGGADGVQQAQQTLERGMRLADTPSSTLVSALAAAALACAAVDVWEGRGQPASERPALARFLQQSVTNARGDWRPGTLPLLWRLRGWEAWLSDQPARARRLWRRSLAVAERLQIPYEVGLSHSLLGQYAVTVEEQQAHLRQASEIFERLGALVDGERVRRAFAKR